MPNDTMPTSARAPLRLRYLLALVIAILIAPVAAFWIWSSVEARRLDRTLDRLEARHEPLDMAAFDIKPATDEQRQASHDYAQASKLVSDLMPRWLTATGRMIEEFCGSTDPVTRKGRAVSLKSLEDRYAPALELLDRASALDAHGWDTADRPPSNSLEAELPYQLARVNAVRIARLACSGEAEPAADALIASLRLRRVLFGTGPLTNIRTGHSLQLVLAAGPSARALARLQQEYDALAAEPRLEAQMQYVRARWLFFAVPGAFSDPPPGFAGMRITPVEAIRMRLSRPWRDHVSVSELREFDEAIDAVSRPWPQVLEAAGALDREYPRRPTRGSVVSAMLGPLGANNANVMLQYYIAPVAESLARTRASIGALAVARWRDSHGGALPPTLKELIPTYLASPLIDPYTGGELNYVKNDRGYKVYSVGRNRSDDGGRWDQHSDLQIARRGDPLDVGIAVMSASN